MAPMPDEQCIDREAPMAVVYMERVDHNGRR